MYLCGILDYFFSGNERVEHEYSSSEEFQPSKMNTLTGIWEKTDEKIKKVSFAGREIREYTLDSADFTFILPRLKECTLESFEDHMRFALRKSKNCIRYIGAVCHAYRMVLEWFENKKKPLPSVDLFIDAIVKCIKENDIAEEVEISDEVIIFILKREQNPELKNKVNFEEDRLRDHWSNLSVLNAVKQFQDSPWTGRKEIAMKVFGDLELDIIAAHLKVYFYPKYFADIKIKRSENEKIALVWATKMKNDETPLWIKEGVYETFLKPWFEERLSTQTFEFGDLFSEQK